MLKQLHLYIKGDVIGVGFRAWIKIQARIHHVTGWVKNEYTKPEIYGTGGGVEALLQGEEKVVTDLLEVIKKGNWVAQVTEVEIFEQDPKELYDEFEIRK